MRHVKPVVATELSPGSSPSPPALPTASGAPDVTAGNLSLYRVGSA